MENDSKAQETRKFYYIIMAATKSVLSLKKVRMLCMVLDLVKITRRHNGNCLSTHKWTLSVWKSFRHGCVVILGNLVFLLLIYVKQLASHIPANNYLFKGNNKNTRKRCKIYSRLIKKTSKHVIDVVLSCLLSTLNILYTIFQYFYCWLWTSEYLLGVSLTLLEQIFGLILHALE